MTDRHWSYILVRSKGGRTCTTGVALVAKNDKFRCIRNENIINERMLLVNINVLN